MTMISDLSFLLKAFVYLLPYVPLTLGLTISSMLGGMVLGLVCALSHQYKVPFLYTITRTYVVLGRSIPTMVLLYLVYFALPLAFISMEESSDITIPFRNISAYSIAIIALILHIGAYLSEVFRAALASVEKGQREAATAMGMSWSQSFRRVVAPQALVYAIPLLGNHFLDLMKSTSLVFSITVVELFGAGQMLSAESYRYTEVYLVVALMYWGLSMSFEVLFSAMERRSTFFKRQEK